MNKFLLIAIFLAILSYYDYTNKKQKEIEALESSSETSDTTTESYTQPAYQQPANSQQFKCDGRTHCSNMTSCAEATFFLQNCPGVEMDGNADGVPCEKQWCN